MTDYGIPGVGLRMISDGVRWVPDGPQMLARSSVPTPHTGSTAETTLVTLTIPAGVMGVEGGVEYRTVWTYPSSANNKTPRVKFGGNTVLSITATTTLTASDARRIRNRGSATAQVLSYTAGNSVGLGVVNATLGMLTVDTTVDVPLTLTAQLASAAETVILQSYEVWLLP